MVVSLKHQFQSALADGPDSTLVRPSNWNAEHTLTQATGTLLGRTTAGTGATEEISPSSELTLSSGTLGVAASLGGKTLTGPSVVNVNSSSTALRITQTGTGNALVVEDSANPDASPSIAVTATGVVLLGDTTSRTIANVTTSRLQVSSENSDGFSAGLSAIAWDADTSTSVLSAPVVSMSRSASDTTGTQAAVVSGNALGSISFQGSDGTSFVRAAQIIGAVDGTPGTNDMPGRLVFSTTADGASSPTERMRITNAGSVGIGVSPASTTNLHLGKAMTGGVNTYGAYVASVVQADSTTSGSGVLSTIGAAASVTTGAIYQFYALQGTFGAGSSVTNQYGFAAAANLTGATNNFGFHSSIAAAAGRWNFYAAGTADNYFAGNVGIGVTTPRNKLDVVGSFGRGAPVTKTGNFTLAATENWVIVNNASADTTVTLPAASSWTGREVMFKNLSPSFTVVSASSNVVPLDSATAGTAILSAGAGKWVTLVSDGTNWVAMAGELGAYGI